MASIDSPDDSPQATTREHMVFNELFRYDVAEKLGFRHDAKKPQKRFEQCRDFLKNIDWDDPHTADKVVRAYIEQASRIAAEQLHYPHTRVSWGSPDTDEHNKILRNNLRIIVQNEETPDERYTLSYTPRTRENGMTDDTQKYLAVLREIIEKDLGIKIPPPVPHPRMSVPKIELPGEAHVIWRNLYDGEGKIWDISLPAEATQKALKDIVSTSRNEISASHVPEWGSDPLGYVGR